MKKLIIIALMFSFSSCATQGQSLFGYVNGVLTKMSPKDSASFVQEQVASKTQNKADSVTLSAKTIALNSIISTAQSSVGVALNNLTATQVRSLLALMLFQMGGVNPSTLAVNPLNQWILPPKQ